MDGALLTSFAAIVAGLTVLWVAGGKVVEYALQVANAFRVTTFFVGFVVLAVAADLPEIAVAITSALRGVSGVSVGDLIGANFCDVALVTGVTSLLAGVIHIADQERRRLLMLLGATTVIMLFVMIQGQLYPWHGYILIGIYAVSIATIWHKRHDFSQDESLRCLYETEPCDPSSQKDYSIGAKWLLVMKLFICLGVVLACSSAIVYFIEMFAVACNLPLETVGATILAAGTSLPELSLSLNALRRKQYALALGPTLGTVLEQCTLVLGLLTVLSKQPVNMVPVRGASIFMFIAFGIVSVSLARRQIRRPVGVVLLTLFAGYMMYHFV